jgi:signal transduction histidine kinase
VTALLEDGARGFWIGLDSVLAYTSREHLLAAAESRARVSYELYDRSDGLTGSVSLMGYPNAVRAADGGLWFTTSAGTVTVPRDRPRRRDSLRVTIDEISVNGRPIAPADVVELPSDSAQVQFTYAALALRGPHTVRFRYQLEGLDPGWIDNGRVRRVSYAAVPPGRYRFRVQASDGSTDTETALIVSIPTAVHQRGWFQGSAALGAACMLMLGWQARLRRVRRATALVGEERTRVSREIHDTLLQSLVGTALHLDNIANTLRDTEPDIALRLSRTRRQLERHIDDAHQAIFELRSPRAQPDLPSALRALCAPESHPDVSVTTHITGQPRACSSQVQHQVLRIAGEALVNARRHGHPKRIDVTLDYPAGEAILRLRVSDDGTGFDVRQALAAPGGHFGLAILRERAQQVRGDLRIDSAPGRGTALELNVPLPRH